MQEHAAPRSIQELDLAPKKPMHPSPSDWRDHFIYFLLVDRFNDGKRHPKYDGTRANPSRDPLVGARWQGGTLKGVTKRLEYIKRLGATAVWLSPVLKNHVDASLVYNGYAIQNFLAVDPRIGTMDDLRALVEKAHGLGMYVILDIVINHTGDNWAYENDSHPAFNHDGTRYPFGFWRGVQGADHFSPDDAVWPAELQSADCYKRRGHITDWNNPEELVDGDFFDLKTLDQKNDIVRETLAAVYKYWICEADIDGFRIDTVKHVGVEPAVAFFNQIKEYAASIGKKNFLLFGEIASGDDEIRPLVGRQPSAGGNLQALDAALDFPLYFVLEEVIKGFASPSALRDRIDRIRQLYPDEDATSCFVTFLDNHDQPSRPYRRFLHGNPVKKQALLGIGYLLTSVGIPNIYYGTEQGFDGGVPPMGFGESFIRECMFGGEWGAFGTTGMHFFDERAPLYRGIAKIAELRKKEPALRYGRLYFREVSEDGAEYKLPEQGFGMLAYSRVLDTTELLVVFNLRGEKYTNHIVMDKSLTPPGTFMTNLLGRGSSLVEERGGRSSLAVTLPPYSMAIFKQKPVAPEN